MKDIIPAGETRNYIRLFNTKRGACMNKPRQSILLALFGVALLAIPTAAQVRLHSVVVGAGATAATNGTHGLVGTIGQAVIGPSVGTTSTAWQGFWYTVPEPPSSAVPGRSFDPDAGAVVLHQNVPNPFSTTTALQFQLPKRAHVSLKLYDAIGHEVRTLMEGEQDAGMVSLQISAADLESGYYTARLVTGGVSRTVSMVVVK
jgi:hypothetical protein